jgi:LysR family glycine cleavage system transcriptional activator
MSRRLPPLTALPAFEATARLGSMKAAGEELGRTHGAISKQIGLLSEDLGIALFSKKGTGVELTQDGRALAEAVTGTLDQLDRVCRRLRHKGRAETLVIAISGTFAMRWLMPRLPRFYRHVPDVEVSFQMTGLQSPSDSEVDAILTFDRLQWGFEGRPDIVRLGDVAFGPVHAPGVELTGADGVFQCETRFLQEIAPDTWKAWERLAGVRLVAERDVAYPHTFLAIEAALSGLGVALLERRLVAEDVRSARLEAPLGFAVVEDGFGAIVPEHARKNPVLHLFLDWLKEEVGEEQQVGDGRRTAR